MPRRRILPVLALIVLGLFPAARVHAQDREGVALVIGNESYDHLPAVGDATADAAGVAVYLRQAGFHVLQYVNLTQGEMLAATLRFLDRLRPGEVGVVYFSGHILQYEGNNFLMPVNAHIRRPAGLLSAGLALNTLIRRIEASEQQSAIFFLEGGLRVDPTGDGALATGMAEPPQTAIPSAFALAVEPNHTIAAADPTLGDFTATILEQATRSGTSLREAMATARDEVAMTRGSAPPPWIRDTLDEPFVMAAEADSLADELSGEHLWNRILALPDGDDRHDALRGYLDRFPDSPHADEARAMLAALTGAEGAPDAAHDAAQTGDAVDAGDDGPAAPVGAPDDGTAAQENRAPLFEAPASIAVTAGSESMPLHLPAPSDPDGDALTVTVTALPDSLAIVLDDAPLAVGDRIAVERLEELTLSAGPDAVSGDSITFEASDPAGATASVTIRFDVEERENRPPVAAAPEPLSVPANAEPVDLDIPAPEDPDGDSLSLTVMTLPQFGQLRVGDAPARVSQELAVEDLSALSYAPPLGQSGDAGALTLVVRDGYGGEAQLRQQITVTPAPTTEGAAAWTAPDGQSDEVRRAQRALQALDLYAGPLDGLHGPGTRAAMQRYQARIDAPRTETLTRRQRAELAVDGAEALAAAAREVAARAEEAAARAEEAANAEGAAEETFVLGVYRGEVEGDTVEGYGVLQAGNGQRFAGRFADNEPQIGVARFQGNSRYAGEQRNGLPHGLGVYEYATGVVFAGEWVGGQIQGLGVSEAAAGVTVAGEWAGNAPIGYGAVTDRTNGRRIGRMSEGRITEVY